MLKENKNTNHQIDLGWPGTKIGDEKVWMKRKIPELPVRMTNMDWNHAPGTMFLTEVDMSSKNRQNRSIDDATPEEWNDAARQAGYPSNL